MSQIFTGTLVEADPFHAVTLVANHDTQPLQALEAPVEASVQTAGVRAHPAA